MKCTALFSFCVLASAVTASPTFVSQYENDGYKSLKSHRGGNNIVDRLREKKEFSRFVEVLEKERGLRDELENKDTTLFAPTNEAFKQLEKEWAATDERGRPEMKDILRYHIAPDAEITADCLHAGALIPTGLRLKSLDDRHQRMRVFRFHNEIWVNMRSRIVEADIEADNGRIHAVDRVIMPPSTVGETLHGFPTKFSTFSVALERTRLSREVCKKDAVTVFAPNNNAWETLGFENLRYLFSCVGQKTESDRESRRGSDEKGRTEPWCQGTKDLRKIVEHHIATKLAYSTDFMEKETTKLKTLGDEQLTVCAKKRQGGGREEDEDRESRDKDESRHRDVRKYNFVINQGDARVQFTDALASNGNVMVIDNIMIPKNVRLPYGNRM